MPMNAAKKPPTAAHLRPQERVHATALLYHRCRSYQGIAYMLTTFATAANAAKAVASYARCCQGRLLRAKPFVEEVCGGALLCNDAARDLVAFLHSGEAVGAGEDGALTCSRACCTRPLISASSALHLAFSSHPVGALGDCTARDRRLQCATSDPQTGAAPSP